MGEGGASPLPDTSRKEAIGKRAARDATDLLLREGILVSAIIVTAGEWRRGQDTFFGRRVQAEGLALA